MADSVDSLRSRLLSFLDEDVVLTAAQLRQEVVSLQACSGIATKSSVIEMLQNIIELLAGGYFRASGRTEDRVKAWGSGSDQDREGVIEALHKIVLNLSVSYTTADIQDGASKRRKVEDFITLAYIRQLNLSVIRKFVNIPEYDACITPTLESMNRCAFKIMDRIVSELGVEGMRRCLVSEDEKNDLRESLTNHFLHVLNSSGEVRESLVTSDGLCVGPWLNLWEKVTRTSNLEYLFYMSKGLNCYCGRGGEASSEFAILEDCYDLLCYQCARTIISSRRRCPVCSIFTEHWMKSTLFEVVKQRLKKRKLDEVE